MNSHMSIFSIVFITLFLVLLCPINLAKASPADYSKEKSIYDQLVKEYDIDKAKMTGGEPINKLELMFKGYALDAVDFTNQNFKKQLNFSEDSIKDVEECLDALSRTRAQYKPTNEQLYNTAKMYAGYIGQVIKLKWGGDWRDESEYSLENGPALKINDQQLFLVSKIYRRIVNGPEDNIWHFYLIFKKDMESSSTTKPDRINGRASTGATDG